jgi:hypothetical protein
LGIGGFVMDYGGYDAISGDYPHNIFLEIGSELGVIGMIAFLWMLGWTFSRWLALRRKARGNQLHVVYTLFAMLVFELINACVSGDINTNRLLFGCLGLVVAFSATEDRLQQSRNIVGAAEQQRKYRGISLTGYSSSRAGALGNHCVSGLSR